jgi:hypothetical protein
MSVGGLTLKKKYELPRVFLQVHNLAVNSAECSGILMALEQLHEVVSRYSTISRSDSHVMFISSRNHHMHSSLLDLRHIHRIVSGGVFDKLGLLTKIANVFIPTSEILPRYILLNIPPPGAYKGNY